MRRVSGPALFLLLAACAAPAGGQEKVDLKVVTYAGLGDTIRQFKGKVVVVDFWAEY